VYLNFGYIDTHVRDHTSELQRQAAHERLVDEALGPRRSVRLRLAVRLHAVARWVEGIPSSQPVNVTS
jgi:hypothetical protein